MHWPEWHEFLGARMIEFVWSVNSNWKSVSFKGCFAPSWLMPASATKSFSVDFLFCTLADFKSSVSEVHDLIFLGRMQNFRPSSLDSHLAWLSWGVSVL